MLMEMTILDSNLQFFEILIVMNLWEIQYLSSLGQVKLFVLTYGYIPG